MLTERVNQSVKFYTSNETKVFQTKKNFKNIKNIDSFFNLIR